MGTNISARMMFLTAAVAYELTPD